LLPAGQNNHFKQANTKIIKAIFRYYVWPGSFKLCLTKTLKPLAPVLRLCIRTTKFKFSHKQLVLVTAPVSTGASLFYQSSKKNTI
jgi:hypothetical protein